MIARRDFLKLIPAPLLADPLLASDTATDDVLDSPAVHRLAAATLATLTAAIFPKCKTPLRVPVEGARMLYQCYLIPLQAINESFNDVLNCYIFPGAQSLARGVAERDGGQVHRLGVYGKVQGDALQLLIFSDRGDFPVEPEDGRELAVASMAHYGRFLDWCRT